MKESLNVCSKDYKNKHYWELVGNVGFDYLIYKCTQCQKSKIVRIKFIDGKHIEEHTYLEEKKNG